MKKKKWLVLMILPLLILPLLFNGCEKDNEPDAPNLPPVSTFVMDLSDFVGKKSMDASADAKGLVATNWGWAASNVLVWNTVLTVNLIVPVASFYEAFNHEGIYEGDNEWVWSYNFMAGGVSHKAELHGFLTEDAVLWEMYISRDGAFTDFLWYSGSHDLLRTEGQWILNGSPDSQSNYLQIDWTRSETDDSADVKYTLIASGAAEYGSYIFYGRTNDLPLDRFYDIYIASTQNLVEIEWSKTTKEGRIKDYTHFQDGLWHCWDSSLQDVACE